MTDFMSSVPFDPTRPDLDWTVLGRFFRGECSPGEAGAIARWEGAAPANAELLAFMRRVWDEAAEERLEFDEDEGWTALRTRIAAASGSGSPRAATAARAVVQPLRIIPADVPRRRGRLVRWGIAAAAAVLIGGVTLVGIGRSGRPPGTRAAATAMREYATTRGQRAEIMLMDGTRVWLNVASRLGVPAGYGMNGRDVELEGEAYFVVAADARRPFRVHTRHTISEDLGTEFDVQAYADDPHVTVTVASGRVAVRSDGAPAIVGSGVRLGRGNAAVVDSAGRIGVTDSVDLEHRLGWRAGELKFEERPLYEALRELERWYDIKVVLEDSSLARVPLTAMIGRRTSDQAFAIIADVLDARYVRQGRVVRLTTDRLRRRP